MLTPLDRIAEDLGEGSLLRLEPHGETLFRLDSYPGNPIVTPQDLGLTWDEDGELQIGAVFNPGAELFDDQVVLTPRCHQRYRRKTYFDAATKSEGTCFENYVPEVWTLRSEDGVHFERGEAVLNGDGRSHEDFVHGIEDVRIIKHGSRYVLVGTGKLAPAQGCEPGAAESLDGDDRIAIYTTDDFRDITYCGMVDAFNTRNAVPLLDSVGGRHYILLRFHPDVHPDIHLDVLEAGVDEFLHPNEHRDAWADIYERHNETVLLEADRYPHEREKVGAGPQVIRTERGWLVLYHAVGKIPADVCDAYGIAGPIERGYSVGAALLAPDDPQRVLCRTRQPIYIPSKPYELYGDDEYPVDIPAVVFPTGAIVRGGKLLIYAGAGDKYIVLLSCGVDKLVDYLTEYCRVAA